MRTDKERIFGLQKRVKFLESIVETLTVREATPFQEQSLRHSRGTVKSIWVECSNCGKRSNPSDAPEIVHCRFCNYSMVINYPVENIPY